MFLDRARGATKIARPAKKNQPMFLTALLFTVFEWLKIPFFTNMMSLCDKKKILLFFRFACWGVCQGWWAEE